MYDYHRKTVILEVIILINKWIAVSGGMILGVLSTGIFGFKGFSQLFNKNTGSGGSSQ
jgi:hypothetical protein